MDEDDDAEGGSPTAALDLAEAEFGANPIRHTAAEYMAALMDAENEGEINDETFRNGLSDIRQWLAQGED